ncbi:sensor histidine kinase [Streptomyces sp. 12297]|uniref:sensor histidine kinase n=1 Tax=Streptomyces sp. NBC_00239 TaxID=2903640 RepID=UPI002E281884|nr:histidine kinase [Streptomyces sp. NBC_00239]
MDVKEKLGRGWSWLKGPDPWPRRRVAAEFVLAGMLALMGAGIADLAGDPDWKVALTGVGVAFLSLLRRRMPAGVLVVSCALGGWLAGMALVTILAGWTAGRRIVGVGRAIVAFTLAFVLSVGVSVAVEGQPLRLLQMIFFATLIFLATTVVPGLASRYWNQRRTLLHAMQDRNAQLLREREMVAGQARLRERQRIAQDMHDSLGHQLALIAVHTGALEVDPALTERQREAVGVLRQASVAAMHELREVVGILRDGVEAPDAGDDAQPAARGVAGIEGVVEAARAAGTEVRLTVSGPVRALAAACDHAAYRIVQEALTNAYKHAPGAAIAVELRYEDDSLVVEIANGPAAGPGAGEVVSGGQGLTGLRERARLVGGMVHAGASPDGGFRVAGVLPYGAEQAGPVVAPVDAADDFGQQAQPVPLRGPGVPGDGSPVDWAAVDRELAGRAGRSRLRGVALGCGIAALAGVLLLIAGGVLLYMVVGTAREATIGRPQYDGVKVGDSERSVRARLPEGSDLLTSGLDGSGPLAPEGSDCLVLLSEETSEDLKEEQVFRFCFKGGKLIEKTSYEVDR